MKRYILAALVLLFAAATKGFAGTPAVMVVVGESGYATLYSDLNLSFPEDVKVFAYSYADSTNTLMSEFVPDGSTLPANQGYVIKAQPGSYTFPSSSSTPAEIKSCLEGFKNETNLEETEYDDDKVYVLGMVDGKLAFYRYTGFIIPANRAFLYLKGVKSNTDKLTEEGSVWTWVRE